jgi:micrococcal nuclease
LISSSRYRASIVALLVWLLFVPVTMAADGEWATVRRIADGDTVELSDHRLIRYIGVNAPEINHELHTAESFGFEARSLNSELVGTKRIRLEYDLERLDAYGRTLAYVFLPDGTMANAKLLQAGLGYYLYKTPNVKHGDLLLRAQHEAMQARRGIWKGWLEARGRYVGNRNSRRFHLASCPEIKRIAPKNRVVYSKRWDAFWAGYSPAKECQPTLIIPVE